MNQDSKPVKERDDLDLLELTCQLNARLGMFPSEDMHNAYWEARNELQKRLAGYAAATPSGQKSEVESLESENLTPHQAKCILKLRDALSLHDYNESYHWLYQIASPLFDKFEPWGEIKKLASAPVPSIEAGLESELEIKYKKIFENIWVEGKSTTELMVAVENLISECLSSKSSGIEAGLRSKEEIRHVLRKAYIKLSFLMRKTENYVKDETLDLIEKTLNENQAMEAYKNQPTSAYSKEEDKK